MLVMTMMVRDEADIIAATLEHHLAQGFDHVIVTDNASVDGTREILDAYAAVAPITVLHDPEHRKQQAAVVTRMARSAFVDHSADWVVNGDADEFVRALDPSRTVAEVLAEMPTSLGAFTVPVVNLVGRMARSGSGLRRLTVRDERSLEALQATGVHAHPTPNAIHVGSADVEVAHGNHFTSIEQVGEVPDGLGLEVLHLPWRSSDQFERKTRNMALGYLANPQLRPSANHHGMRDWRRLKADALLPFLARRMPTSDELDAPGFRVDESLVDALAALDGVLPDQLAAALDDRDDRIFDDREVLELRAQADALAAFDAVAAEEVVALREEVDARNVALYEAQQHLQALEATFGAYDLDGLHERIARERTEAFEDGVRTGDDERRALAGSLDDARAQATRLHAEVERLAAELAVPLATRVARSGASAIRRLRR